MRRSLTLACLFVLALAVALPHARAEEDGTSARPSLPFALEDFELLPVHDIEWALVAHEHPDLVTRLHVLGQRMERVHQHLEARAKKDDAGSLKLVQQLQRLAVEIAPHVTRLLEVLEPLGVDEGVLEVLEDTPRGPLRIERHAMRLVAKAPDLDVRQREIHARLVPAVEGALLALHAGRSRIENAAELDGATKTALLAKAEVLMKSMQVRFWRVVDATLTPDQRAFVHRRLPKEMAKHPDFISHLFVLPGLTPTQGARLRSLLVRLEQEAAPDQAEVKRANAALEGPRVDGSRRTKLEGAKAAAERRNLERAVDAYREGLAILTPEQVAALRSIPPMLTAKDRPGDLEVLVGEVAWRPDQKPALEALHRKYAPVKGRLTQRMMALAIQSEDIGPDTPEQEAMQVRQAQAWAEALVEARKAATEIFRDLLTTEQILTWVVR